MKRVEQIIRLIFLLCGAYAGVCYWMNHEYAPPVSLPKNTKHTPLKEAVKQPALCDGASFRDTLLVISTEHPALDAFYVSSFRASRNGSHPGIQVFLPQGQQMPTWGDFVLVEGMYSRTQIKGYFEDECCVLAVKVTVLNQVEPGKEKE